MVERSIAEDVAAVGRIPAVQKILQVVSQTTGMRFAAVARVTETRWTACAVRDSIDFGLAPGGELALETTICNEIRQHRQPVVFGHASEDPKYRGHPTPKLYGFESYISIPIFRRDGDFFGTLCAIDPAPAKLDDPAIVQSLELFAELISEQLEAEDQLSSSREALQHANELATLREQFIAVLGHDLRSPLTVLTTYTHLLRDERHDRAWRQQVEDMLHSCGRMSVLIDNLLDLARGRLGDGIPLALQDEVDLQELVGRVVSEVRTARGGHAIEARYSLARTVSCDPDRIQQLLVNLLDNAVTHGSVSDPVEVLVYDRGDMLEIAVCNRGPAIPEFRRRHLFEPFVRNDGAQAGEGLGLGLFIAAEIAKAHGGALELDASDEDGTRFVFRMPWRRRDAPRDGAAEAAGTASR